MTEGLAGVLAARLHRLWGTPVEVTSLTQLYELIALGRATAIVPESSKTDLRRDLAAVPVTDAVNMACARSK